jgi:hypothetical protein
MHHTAQAITDVVGQLQARGVLGESTVAAMRRAFLVAYGRSDDRRTETAKVLLCLGNGLR